MKNHIYKSVCYILIISFLTPLQSCMVTGALIGGLKENKDQKKSKIALIDAKGWIHPASTRFNIELTLNNGEQIYGRYQGRDFRLEESNTVEFVLIKKKGNTQSIPAHEITNTKIYPVNTNSATTGFLVGAGIDALVILAIYSGGGILGDSFNLSLGGW